MFGGTGRDTLKVNTVRGLTWRSRKLYTVTRGGREIVGKSLYFQAAKLPRVRIRSGNSESYASISETNRG